MFTLISLFLVLICCTLDGADVDLPKTRYHFNNDPIDVVIPCTDKDLPTLNMCIQGIRINGQNVRRIIVVSDKKLTDEAEWFDEKNYPFTKYDIALAIFHGDHAEAQKFLTNPRTRVGWIFAQCLKLYAVMVIPGISSNALIIDSDTVFVNPVAFLNKSGGGCYNPGTEYHMPYFYHMHRLLPGLKRLFPQYSGISHHMLFQRPVMEDLFRMIYEHHNMEAWRAICHCIDHKDLYGSACADYEIYFSFAFARTNQVSLRPLRWVNTGDLDSIPHYKAKGYHHVSCHSYMR